MKELLRTLNLRGLVLGILTLLTTFGLSLLLTYPPDFRGFLSIQPPQKVVPGDLDLENAEKPMFSRQEVNNRLKEEQAELWFAFRDIIQTRCLKCHDGPMSTSGVNLNGHDTLIKSRKEDRDLNEFPWNPRPWSYVTPGRPEDSLLYKLVREDLMPRGETKLGIAEQTIIKMWIEKGAPGPPIIEAREFLSPRQEHQAIVEYLQGLPAADRQHQRFLSLSSLHNNRTIPAEHLAYYRSAVSKLVNSLSWQTKIVVPVPIPGMHDSVYVIDLRQLGWEPKVWTDLLQEYPYGWVDDESLAEKMRELTGSPLPVLRADWFAHAGSRPPLYHSILQLPDNAVLLEKKLGIDFEKNFRDKKLVRAAYLGASTTTSGFRVAERQEIKTHPGGGYWRSYDFGQGMSREDTGNPLIRPLGPYRKTHPYPEKAFIHQGSEILFTLPNGMQGYLVVDSDDERLDEPPTSVLKDKNEFSGSTALVNGISCMACHAQGINNVVDQVRDEGTGKKFGSRLLEWTEAIYPPKEKMDELLKQDRERFVKSLNLATAPFMPKNLTVPLPKTEMIHALSSWYRKNVGVEEAARELGYADVEAFKTDLKAKHEAIKGLGFKTTLLQEGGRVSRQEWARVFPKTVQGMGLGVWVLGPPRTKARSQNSITISK